MKVVQPPQVSAATARDWSGSHRLGSLLRPSRCTSKWRWTPSHMPVQPTVPIVEADVTASPVLHADPLEMGVHGLEAAAVVDHDPVAVARLLAGGDHQARGRGVHRRAGGRVDVDARMERVAAVAERARHGAADRPDECGMEGMAHGLEPPVEHGQVRCTSACSRARARRGRRRSTAARRARRGRLARPRRRRRCRASHRASGIAARRRGRRRRTARGSRPRANAPPAALNLRGGGVTIYPGPASAPPGAIPNEGLQPRGRGSGPARGPSCRLPGGRQRRHGDAEDEARARRARRSSGRRAARRAIRSGPTRRPRRSQAPRWR